MVLKGCKIRRYSMEQYNQAIKLRETGLGSLRISHILNVPRPTIESWINRGTKPYYFSESRIKASNSEENIERMIKMNKITQPKASRISAELRTKRLPTKARILNENLAYILGVVHGDGHVSIKQRKVILSAVDKDFVLNFKSNIEEWSGFKTRFFERIQKPDDIIKNRKPQWRCYIDSLEASKFLKKFDLNLLFNASDDVKNSFIRGFFDSEGSICKGRICFYNTDYYRINLVNELLNSMNINTILKKRKYLNNLTNRVSIVYNLYIRGNSKIKFSQTIGSTIGRKQEKLNTLMITKK